MYITSDLTYPTHVHVEQLAAASNQHKHVYGLVDCSVHCHYK